ncbi:hypothetical protein [Rickettsia asembonensis]|nr:hypothetical protein [Rickettsia asembonensis]
MKLSSILLVLGFLSLEWLCCLVLEKRSDVIPWLDHGIQLKILIILVF